MIPCREWLLGVRPPNTVSVLSGVPQSFVLGPLFLKFILSVTTLSLLTSIC